MLLLALYYQLARDLSALHTGLLLDHQGVGAMLTMPVAGKLTDRIGPGAIVLGRAWRWSVIGTGAVRARRR